MNGYESAKVRECESNGTATIDAPVPPVAGASGDGDAPAGLTLVRTKAEVRAWVVAQRAAGLRVGLVPIARELLTK